MVNPFDPDLYDVCLPLGEALPSLKATSMVKVIMETSSTTGIGFVAFRPNICNDVAAMSYTNVLYVGTAATNVALTGTGITQVNPGGTPFSQTFFATNNVATSKHALTACRIRYIGPENYRGGQITMFNDYEDYQVVGMSLNDMASRKSARTFSVDREWKTLIFSSNQPALTRFVPTGTATDYTDPVTANKYPCVIFARTPIGSPSTLQFEVEFLSFSEVRYVSYATFYSPPMPIEGPEAAATQSVISDSANGAESIGQRAADVVSNIAEAVTTGFGSLPQQTKLGIIDSIGRAIFGQPIGNIGAGGLLSM